MSLSIFIEVLDEEDLTILKKYMKIKTQDYTYYTSWIKNLKKVNKKSCIYIYIRNTREYHIHN